MFQRTYTSDRQEDAGLGRGWSFTFNDFITLHGDHATLTTADGNTLAFHRDGQSNRFRLDVEQPTTHAQFEITDTETLTETNGDTTCTYARRGDAFRLARVRVGNLIGITINHNARGLVTRIANDTGGTLRLNWSNAAHPRLLSVTDHAKRQVTFQQTGKTLTRVTDPAGAAWSYDYKDERLTRAVDPMKRTLLRTRYDASGHVVETGDAVGTTRFDYEFAAPEVSRRTTITDPLGAQTFYEHNERGALTATSDDEGNTARIEYNAANRPVRVSASTGDEVKFDYDADNRLIKQESSDGANKSFAYNEQGRLRTTVDNGARTDFITDEQGNLVPVQAGNGTPDYRTTHNARGQLTLLKSADREISFEYDANGNQTAYTYSDVGRFEKTYDAAGRMKAERLPSGLTYTNDYDARGWLKTRRDNRGRAVTVERDASGLPVAYVRADGKRKRAARDEAGRVVEETDFDGKVRRFAYDRRGALTGFVDKRGARHMVEYDRRGRVRTLIEEDGSRRTVERDERGRIKRVASVKQSEKKVNFLSASYIKHASNFAFQDGGLLSAPDDWFEDTILFDTTWGTPWRGYIGSHSLYDGQVEFETNTNESNVGGGDIYIYYEECAADRARIIEERRVSCRREKIAIWVTIQGTTVNAAMITAAATSLETVGIGAVLSALVGGIVFVGASAALSLELRGCNSDAEDNTEDIPLECGRFPRRP